MIFIRIYISYICICWFHYFSYIFLQQWYSYIIKIYLSGASKNKFRLTDFPVGIQLNYPVSTVTDTCTLCYGATYATGTLASDILGCSGPYLFVGAAASGATVFSLGAYALASQIQTYSVINVPVLYNGAYWYFTASKSVGFSLDYAIDQNHCDTLTSNGAYRLCWHLVLIIYKFSIWIYLYE